MIFTRTKNLFTLYGYGGFGFLALVSVSLLVPGSSAAADMNTSEPSRVGSSKSTASKECIDLSRVRSIFSKVSVGLSPYYDRKTGESAKFDECAPGRLSYKLIRALMLLEDVGPARPEEIKPFVKSTYWDYFRSKVKLLILDGATDGMCSGPYVGAYAAGNHTIHVCPILSQYSTFEIAGALVHEARHLVGEGYGRLHVVCKQGYFEGQEACDESLAEGGSYGVQYQMMVRTANTASIDPLIRQEAAKAIPQFLEYRFNVRPSNIEKSAGE
jgi:hypothetical protein